MAYASYDFYIEKYYGNKIPVDDFDRLAERASEYIDSMTMNRAKGYNDTAGTLKKACCAVAELDLSYEGSEGKNNESIGKWSVSYQSDSDREHRKYSLLKSYLACTGLLYMGMG